MTLSEAQKCTVAEWFAAGAGVAEIQKRISAEFNIDMTYLEVRLLVADLPQPTDQESPKTPDVETSDVPDPSADMEDPADSSNSAGGDELSVSVDPLAPPGAIACGSVVFSDGTEGKWMFDQMGRLGLSGLPEGYRPSPEDGAQFQAKLVAALRAKGLA